ncbi:hypothetical protein I6A94_16925, partial [Frankia sp. CN4]
MSARIDRIDSVGPIDTMGWVEPLDQRKDDGLGCLRTERGNLPLDTLDVQATLTGLAASCTLTQGFHNPHDEPLEATYIFPLPPRAAVTAMRMEADGRVVDAELKERGQARADYDAGGGPRAGAPPPPGRRGPGRLYTSPSPRDAHESRKAE